MQLSVLLNYGVWGILGLLAVIGALCGLSNGISRQTIRLISIMISAVLSFFICMAIYPLIFGWLEDKTVSQVLAKFGIVLVEGLKNIVDCIEPQTEIYLLALPLSLVVIPLLFILVFIIVSLIMLIPYVVFSGIFGFEKRCNNDFTRLLGAVVGFVQGVIVALVILLPIAGTINTLSTAIGDAEAKHPDSNNTQVVANIYHQNLDAVENNFVIKLLNERFGYVYNRFVTVEVGGADVNMTTVVSDAFELFVLYGDLGGADFNALTPENKETIAKMTHDVGSDRYIATLLSGMLRAVSGAFDKGAIQFSYPEPLLGFMNSFIHIFSTTTEDTIEGDLTTTENLYFILSDSGMLKAGDMSSMFDSISGAYSDSAMILSKLTAELNKNPRFRKMSKELSNMTMKLLLDNKGVDADAEEVIEDLTNNINDIISIKKEDYATEEEYKDEVSTSINEALANQGIPLEPEQLDKVTDFVIDEFEGKEEITEADFADFMAKYYNEYLKMKENGGSESGEGNEGGNPGIPPNVEIPDDFELPDGVEIPSGVESSGKE